MTQKIAISGFGRIGRLVLRAIYDKNRRKEAQVVAINDLVAPEVLAHLLKYDTVHGKFNGDVKLEGNELIVNGDRIKILSEKDPSKLPWKALNVDVVHECTGKFTEREKAKAHLDAGAKKVLISAPGGKDVDATIVYGVNHKTLKAAHTIVSNASCTTNCLAPMVKPLLEKLGIVKGLMVTIHSFTNDQVLIDAPHKDLRRARAATMSMIPTKTGAAAAVGLVIPEMKGLLDGYAIRVPTINVSMVDLTFEAKRATTVEEVNQILRAASEGELKGILAYNVEPLVSCDFNHCEFSSVFESSLTKVIGGNLVKVSAWYDNEWAFSNRMIDTTIAMMQAK
jgi:glyceraldehyde 3-phosphate dehydrogenase